MRIHGPRALRHVLNFLLLVQRQFQSAAVRIHALQDLSVLQTCLKERWVEREPDTLLDALVLSKRVNATLLQVHEAALLTHLSDADRRLDDRRALRHQDAALAALLSLKLDLDFRIDRGDGLERPSALIVSGFTRLLLLDRDALFHVDHPAQAVSVRV